MAVQVATPVPHKTQTPPDGEEEYPVIQFVAKVRVLQAEAPINNLLVDI